MEVFHEFDLEEVESFNLACQTQTRLAKLRLLSMGQEEDRSQRLNLSLTDSVARCGPDCLQVAGLIRLCFPGAPGVCVFEARLKNAGANNLLGSEHVN